MREYGVKWVLTVMMASLLLILAGCSGGGSTNVVDKAAIQKAVQEQIALFKTAVETYDVDVMLGFLEQSSFELTIAEAGSSIKKDYTTLKKELEEDQAKQLKWRQDPPEGYGYVLTMELSDITYTDLSNSGAVVTLSFLTKEKSAEIEELVTDRGTMVLELIKQGNSWLCQYMTINFGQVTPLSGLQLVAEPTYRKGLGLGPSGVL